MTIRIEAIIARALLFALALLLHSGAAAAEQAQGEDGTAKRPGRQAVLSYTPELQGGLSDTLRELITKSIDTFTLQEQPPRSRNLLQRRMQDDVPTIRKILGSLGYFKGEVTTRIEQGQEEKLRAIVKITAGKRFTFGKLKIQLNKDSDQDAPLPGPAESGLVKGAPYLAKDVLDAQKYILARLGNKGYPFPTIESREVTADHKTDKVSVIFTVDSGPKAVFGPVTVKGLKYVEKPYLVYRLPWKEGQLFDARLLDDGRSALIQTGLFSMATMKREQVTAQGEVPITIKATERKPRTVRAGLRYRTDTGPGGKLEWEHRTLFGEGENLHASLEADQTIQMLDISFRKPSVLLDPLSLVAKQQIARERDDAYDGEWSLTSVGLEYEISRYLTGGQGISYRLSRIFKEEDSLENGTFGLLSFPGYLRWDSRNDILNPTKGWRLNLSAAPYFDTLGNSSHFLQGQASYTHYIRLVGEDDLILAVRGLIGSTLGAKLSEVPSDVRFYAGGGSSVRGYDYRKAGDLDSDGDPIGGRSVFESSAELRWRFLGDYGLVAFMDVGRAYEQEFPDIQKDLFFGAGMGVRYYSFVGPVGVDVAVPLNGRGEDDNYQIYVSLGQSF